VTPAPRANGTPATRVALVRPSWEFPANPAEPYIHNRYFAPLSLAITAAMLRQRGIGARIVDAHALRLSPGQVASLVEDCDMVFVTSSALDRWECPNVDIAPFVHCVQRLSRGSQQVHILGVHGTIRPTQVLAQTGARASILGEPELAVLDLALGVDPAEIPGLCVWRDGAPVLTGGERPLLDLDSHPLPAFDLLPMHRYSYVLMGSRSVILEGSRGCPHKCTTCLQAMYGPVYRRKSGKTLIREVRHAVERHGARNIVFIDMEFCLNRPAVEELCDFLARSRYDIRWCCNTRADAVDPPLLHKMKAAGCTLVNYGVESGDQQMVDRINKRLDLAVVERAIRITRETGIDSLAFFMLGLPGETWEQMRTTTRFAEKLAPDYVSYHIFTPYPCTAAFDQVGAPSEPLFPASSGEHSEAELRRFIRDALLRFYLRPGFVVGTGRRLLRQRDLRRLLGQAQLFLSYVR
jgi:anaerobic magnesium-protoporphyrin IX monomethyl ester cyclase